MTPKESDDERDRPAHRPGRPGFDEDEDVRPEQPIAEPPKPEHPIAEPPPPATAEPTD
jgi:hypothetical protein